MNWQETISSLEETQNQLLSDYATQRSNLFGSGYRWDWGRNNRERDIWWIIENLKKNYKNSLAQEINSDKIKEAFKRVEGFTKQKQDIESILMLQNYAKKKNIRVNQKGRILCFVGPPGVGKTFFAKKLAAAMGRKFFRINVGGESNPQLIVGSEPTFVGAKVGGIIEAIRTTDSRDPVILLDEIEKTGENHQEGNLKDALLHVLDPEQNKEFTDKFINATIDISEITFVLTANDETKIPGPLKNRLEIIRLKGYNKEEKLNISKMIIDEIFEADYNNANRDLLEIKEEALRTLIEKNKEEKGVRKLKREIEEIIRWCFGQWAKQNEKGENESKIIVDVNKVNELFPENPDEKEESEEDKLRKRIEELTQENENLMKKPLSFQLFKPLVISEDKKYCSRHQKNTLQTNSPRNCALCVLEEKAKQFTAIINKENQEIAKNVY